MRTVTNNKITIVLCAALALLMSTPLAFAYPPDNAAVLYYRACISHNVDSAMQEMLSDLSKGEIKLNEEIRKLVKRNRYAIAWVITAAEIQNCDWGLDYSEGMSVLMPPFYDFRNLSRLIVADAKILAEQADYETALDRYLSLHKFARHVSDCTLVSHLVGISMNNMANKCFQDVLAEVPEDLATLNWLKNELVDIASRPFSAKTALNEETKWALMDMRMEKIDEVLKILSGEGSAPYVKLATDRINTANEEFFEKNREYYTNFMARFQAVLDMPYPQAYETLEKLQPEKDLIENPDATLAALFSPALSKVYSIAIKEKTFSNAIRTAVDIYIMKAKTGKLPDELSADSPLDLFSGKPFQYAKTAEGFILRCQGRDLDKDEIHGYEFKIKK